LDENLIIPDPDMSIRAGAIAPFRSEQWSKHFRDLIRVAAEEQIDIDAPWSSLSKRELEIVWNGQDGYIGVSGFFKYLKSRSYKMHYRIFLARYRGYTHCPSCDGSRLQEHARYVKIQGEHIGNICELTVGNAYKFFEGLDLTEHEIAVAGRVLEEIRKRLKYLVEVGLEYLTLERLAHTLSGGESQRINLATSLGSSLVGSLYVLDEPSIGLHPRDSERLISILENLRDIGNTVLVVEHDADTILRADHVVDLGPGAGIRGGQVMFSGTPKQLLKDPASLTGAYLSGQKRIEVPKTRRPVDPERMITVDNAREHNLKRVTVSFPLNSIVCVTGVSGSGKSTLVNSTLYRGLRRVKGMHDDTQSVGAHSSIRGHVLIDQVEMVDQSPIGRTPRSNPISYIKAYSAIRDLLSNTHQAKVRGYRPGYFSFNVPGGRCETCQGEGVVKIEMQFLADLYLECEDCKGKRFKREALDVFYKGKNIDDILRMTVEEGVDFFAEAKPIAKKLRVLDEIGMGYLQLGQPSNTLSGGEAQRVKLAANLAKAVRQHTLYIFDEPTTGLHFDDIQKLLASFQKLVDRGHSVIIIEHNLDVIKSADWVIDLGPEGGIQGGFVVAEGPPEVIASVEKSYTGSFLKDLL
jgi:excinuclease ABC subunit A